MKEIFDIKIVVGVPSVGGPVISGNGYHFSVFKGRITAAIVMQVFTRYKQSIFNG